MSRTARLRLFVLAALVAVQFVCLLTRFDAGVFHDAESDVVRAFAGIWKLPKLLLAVGAAGLLFGGSRFREELVPLVTRERHASFLALQIAGFATFFASGLPLLEGRNENWLAPWLVAGFGWGALTLLALAPLREWIGLARRQIGALTAIACIGVLAHLAGRYSTSELWDPLRESTLVVSHALLSWMTDDVVLDASNFILGTSRFRCQISPECSGFEGIGLVWVFCGSYLWLFRRDLRFPNALVVPVVGTVLVWFANAARITTLVAIGSWYSPDLAVEGFHSIAGMAAFCVFSLGLLAVSRKSSFITKSVVANGVNWTAVYLSPLLLAVGAAVFLGPFSSGLDVLYPMRPVLAIGLLVLMRHRLPPVRFTPTWRAVSIGVAAWVVWMIALRLEDGPPREIAIQSEWHNLPVGWGLFWITLRITGTVWMAPWTEELAFRGYLQRRLVRSDFREVPLDHLSWPALLGASVFFGLTHHYWIAATVCGALYGWAQVRGKSLSDAVVAHATTNALLVVYALSTGDWSVWL